MSASLSITAASEASPPAPAAGAAGSNVVRFGIVTFYNPRLMVLRYQPFLDALERRTPYRFELILSRSYSETVKQLQTGEVDLAYLGPVTYVRARKRFGAVPLVRLNTGGHATYHAMICVREDSPIEDLAQLKGRRFAFGSALSTSSHLYPRLMLMRAGLKLPDLASFSYYRHHDTAAKAVLTGEVDACGIRDVVARRYADLGLRVIAVSDPIPNFPLVVAPDAPDTLLRYLREALLGLDPHAPADSAEMASWDEELRGGFAPVDPAFYDEVEQRMLEVFGPSAYEGDLTAPGAVRPQRGWAP